MCYYIGIESLVANALIELLKDGCREVCFDVLERYGAEVVNFLNANGQEAVLVLSREQTRGFIVNCSEYFDVEDPERLSGFIRLKDEYGVEDIAEAFCGGIAVQVLKAFLSESALGILRAA